MASREHETSAQPWGTLEELLLVCAVNRHGPNSWDSVASELHSRSSSSSAAPALTPHSCRDKFDDLRRRYDAAADADGGVDVMVDELRRLRVEELRREVRRRDVSIVSLESKVKKMEEDRDRSLNPPPPPPAEDLHRGGGGEETAPSEKLAGKSNSGEDFVSDSSERENRSFNESNSTSQRSDAKPNGVVEKKAEADVAPGPGSDPAQPQTRSEPASANGKVIDDDDVDGGEPSGRPDEVVGAKRAVEKEVRKQNNSDVQSSASLSRKRKRRRKGGESSSGEEPEGGEEVSPATTKRVKLVKLEPLVKVLRLVRSHRLGSVFQRRLRSQESQRYKNLIREHVDLHVVQSRLDKGVYKDCSHKFFRDLLLVFSNAVVFYRKAAPEHVAALELRSLVLKEMNDQLPKPQPAVSTVKPKPNIESDITTTTTTTSMRPSKSSSIVVCGKRGSINALSENKKGTVRKVEVEEKEAKVKVEDIDATVKVEEKGVRKRRSTQERRGGGRLRTTTTNRKNVDAKTNVNESGGNGVSLHEGLEVVKTEKKEDLKKKQGAASFLKRMKQNSGRGVGRGSNGSDVSEDESKDCMVDEEEEDEVEVEQEEKKKKRTGRKKTDQVEKKERVTRSASGNRGRRGGRGQESGGRGRRGVGRPPKKPETAVAGSGKRGRDNGEADQVGSAGRPRKRTRR
uniref:uncharacterized protein LOC101311266 n=1 Tax=Fragaria vesca subsp. vesca TaxID=101020 RepID=UPI0005CB7908|nr:PREDICTED: uncharacterized protein LOC101311266 [Fragaria vesca subsp. vesca]